MPLGMIAMHWDLRGGAEILAKYPEELIVEDNVMIQLYTQHELAGDTGFVTLSSGAMSVASYYSGTETAIYLILVLNVDEVGDVYEEGLADMMPQILLNLENDQLGSILQGLFSRISHVHTFELEQRLAFLYENEIKRMVLNRFRNEIVIPKSEVGIWLRDKFKHGFLDIDSIVNDFVKNGLIRVSSVKNAGADLLFLVSDLMILRIPPLKLIKDPVGHHLPQDLKQIYLRDVRGFFTYYRPSTEDSLRVINDILLDPANYQVFKLLREAIVTRDDLEKLRRKGVEDVDKALKAFWNNKMINVFHDEQKREYFGLICDFTVERFFPRYLLDFIRQEYRIKSENPKILLKAISILKEEYQSLRAEAKQAVLGQISEE